MGRFRFPQVGIIGFPLTPHPAYPTLARRARGRVAAPGPAVARPPDPACRFGAGKLSPRARGPVTRCGRPHAGPRSSPPAGRRTAESPPRPPRPPASRAYVTPAIPTAFPTRSRVWEPSGNLPEGRPASIRAFASSRSRASIRRPRATASVGTDGRGDPGQARTAGRPAPPGPDAGEG